MLSARTSVCVAIENSRCDRVSLSNSGPTGKLNTSVEAGVADGLLERVVLGVRGPMPGPNVFLPLK